MIDFVHSPPNDAPITELFAFVSLDAGGEGICASILPNLGSVALVTGRRSVAEQMKEFAREIAALSGKPVHMIRFTRAERVWSSAD